MTAADAGTAVLVFARVPAPGAVKTRLIPLLGPEGAAALHVRLLKRTLATVRAAALRPIWLYGAPGVDDAVFRFCAAQFGTELAAQDGADLGARMLAAFKSALANHPRALLLGTDCPALTARHLRQADRTLRDGADAVLVPCEDGGYALMGLKRVDAMLFDGIAWGSANVMVDTRSRLTALGWRWRELDTLWDVDLPEDYDRLLKSGLLDDRRAMV
jgi:rSAM/selenodomain-associated transferase 1